MYVVDDIKDDEIEKENKDKMQRRQDAEKGAKGTLRRIKLSEAIKQHHKEQEDLTAGMAKHDTSGKCPVKKHTSFEHRKELC